LSAIFSMRDEKGALFVSSALSSLSETTEVPVQGCKPIHQGVFVAKSAM
jgi:hypothetical protein